MPENAEAPSTRLGEVLTHALERSIGTSLSSLHELRAAVQSYARNQKLRGTPLDKVMLALGAVLMEAEDEKEQKPEMPAFRDPGLATQLRAWCSEVYAE
jgi:hypothetical protein